MTIAWSLWRTSWRWALVVAPLLFCAMAVQSARAGSAEIDNGLIDLTVSMTYGPAGDGDGSTQGAPGSEEQDNIEAIIARYADAVYESTEAAHSLRTVRIYTNGLISGQADIIWDRTGIPQVPGGGNGVGEPGGRILMFDEDSRDAFRFIDSEEDCGYALGHEWSHYFYGLYDEHFLVAGDIAVSNSMMNFQYSAVGGDYDWLNFSIAWHGGGESVVYGPWENTRHTQQHRVFGESAWETLSRSTANDPTNLSLGRRVYYADLTAVAPTAGNTPGIDLPGTARANLQVLWMKGEYTYEIVLDRSGSMAGTKLDNAKAAAKLLVGLLELGMARVGVIQFDDVVEVVTPITLLDSEATRNGILADIDTIQAGDLTAIGDAAQRALDELVALGANGERKTVFLLSDGLSNAGVDPLSVLPSYVAAGIPIMTFAYGSDADTTTLSAMAAGTAGSYYYSPATLADLASAFQDANAEASSTITLTAGSASAPLGSPTSVPFVVDSALRSMAVVVTHAGSIGAATVQLKTPGDTVVSPTRIDESGGSTLYLFSIAHPAVGEWHLLLSSSGSSPVAYRVSGVPGQLPYEVTGYSYYGANIASPTPLLLMAKVHRGQSIRGAAVTVLATRPDSSQANVTLTDNGNGTYSAPYAYNQNGVYRFHFQVGNSAGTAAFTHNGAAASAASDGLSYPLPADLSVGENFTRAADLQVTVSGIAQFINVTPYSATAFTTWRLDRNTGAMIGNMIVSNRTTSVKTLSAPFWYVLQASQNIALYQVDGYTNGLPYTDISAKVNAALQAKYGRQTMQPGEWVVIDSMRFWSRDRSIPQLSAMWALYADPPGGTTKKLDAYDFNKDGLIGDPEIQKVIVDWRNHDMSTQDYRRRLKAWKTSGRGVGVE